MHIGETDQSVQLLLGISSPVCKKTCQKATIHGKTRQCTEEPFHTTPMHQRFVNLRLSHCVSEPTVRVHESLLRVRVSATSPELTKLFYMSVIR